MTAASSLPVPIPRYSRVVEEISQLRTELDRVVSIEELYEAGSRLKAVEAYARAKGAKDITDQAAETRIWVERRAGELVNEDPRTFRDIAKDYEVGITIITRWRLFASPSRDRLEREIDRIRSDRDLTLNGVREALTRIEEDTGKPGITRMIDGRFRLRWKHGEVNHYHVCPDGLSLKQATGTLQRLKDKTKNKSKISVAGIPAAYEHVRKALASIDAVLAGLPADSREKAEEAMSALYTAEERIADARRLNI